MSFQASFSYLSKCLSPLVLELKLLYQKESLSRVFSKEISRVFHHKSILVFSHILDLFPLPYLSYRRVIVRVFLGDQSVEITEVFHLVFEEMNLRVRVVSSSCGNSCRGAASAS